MPWPPSALPSAAPAIKRRAPAADEVANHEGEIGKSPVGDGRSALKLGEVKADVRLLKWMTGFLIAVVLGVFAL